MPIICWNYRGLGNPTTVASLTDLGKHFSPSLVFLSETKCATTVIKRIQKRTGLGNGVWVESDEKAGDLALIWRKEVVVSLRSKSKRHINVSIRHSTGEHWRFSGIYGWSDHGQKHYTWDLIRRLGKELDMAWLIGGDFNEVLYAHEKRGGNPSDFLSMKAFRDSLDCFKLTEVSPQGYSFTWRNGRTEGLIEERLDRAVGNPDWHDIFRDATTETIIWDSSDHYPICISFGELQTPSTCSSLVRKKIFWFEAKWLQVDTFDLVMADFWDQSVKSGLSTWSARVKHCGKLLLRWDHVTFKRTQ